MRSTSVVEALTELISGRARHQEILRATLGDGAGNVLYPPLDDYVYIRIRGAQSQVTVAHNLQVPNINNLYVDVERDTRHNQVNYRVLGLTEGFDFPSGTQPIANVVLHGYTHAPDGYDPIGIRYRTVFVAGAYTVLATDELLLVDTTAARAITLPDALTLSIGHVLTVKDSTGTANTFNITITPSGTQTIDGAASKVINTAYGVLRLVTDSHNWLTL